MPKSKNEGQVSRIGLWLSWIPAFLMIWILLPIWISIWAYVPMIGDTISLGYVFMGIGVTVLGIHFFIPKKHADWRMNTIYVMIFSLAVAIYLLLNAYLNWWTTIWF